MVFCAVSRRPMLCAHGARQAATAPTWRGWSHVHRPGRAGPADSDSGYCADTVCFVLRCNTALRRFFTKEPRPHARAPTRIVGTGEQRNAAAYPSRRGAQHCPTPRRYLRSQRSWPMRRIRPPLGQARKVARPQANGCTSCWPARGRARQSRGRLPQLGVFVRGQTSWQSVAKP